MRLKARAVLTALLALAVAAPVIATATRFNDVPADHQYAEAINWVRQEGVFLGYPGNEFRPDQEFSDSQFGKVLRRLLDDRYDGLTRAEAAAFYYYGLTGLERTAAGLPVVTTAAVSGAGEDFPVQQPSYIDPPTAEWVGQHPEDGGTYFNFAIRSIKPQVVGVQICGLSANIYLRTSFQLGDVTKEQYYCPPEEPSPTKYIIFRYNGDPAIIGYIDIPRHRNTLPDFDYGFNVVRHDKNVDLTVVFMDYRRNATGTFDLLYSNGQPYSTGNRMVLGNYSHGKYLQAQIPWEEKHCGKIIYFRIADHSGTEYNKTLWYPGCPAPPTTTGATTTTTTTRPAPTTTTWPVVIEPTTTTTRAPATTTTTTTTTTAPPAPVTTTGEIQVAGFHDEHDNFAIHWLRPGAYNLPWKFRVTNDYNGGLWCGWHSTGDGTEWKTGTSANYLLDDGGIRWCVSGEPYWWVEIRWSDNVIAKSNLCRSATRELHGGEQVEGWDCATPAGWLDWPVYQREPGF